MDLSPTASTKCIKISTYSHSQHRLSGENDRSVNAKSSSSLISPALLHLNIKLAHVNQMTAHFTLNGMEPCAYNLKKELDLLFAYISARINLHFRLSKYLIIFQNKTVLLSQKPDR